jgi:hypothetical protein
MTQKQLIEAARRLARSEERYRTTTEMMIESMNQLNDQLGRNREFFQKHLHAFDATEELMRKQVSLLRDISAGMEAIVKGSAATNLEIHENTARMTALLTKVESYFGTGAGLDYDN